jgi:hypothetical protein
VIRNLLIFFAAVALYAFGVKFLAYVLPMAGIDWGAWPVLFFHIGFGVAGYLAFTGNSRAVLVLVACVASGIAFELVAPDQRHSYVQIVVSVGFGLLAAISTNLSGWVARQAREFRERLAAPAAVTVEGEGDER